MKTLYLVIGLLFSSNGIAKNITAADAYAAMALPNDSKLLGAPSSPSWSTFATIVQGVPRGDAGPSYWAEEMLDQSLLTPEPWNALTAWFTVFEAQENTVSEGQVHVGQPEVWILRESEINDKQAPQWQPLPIEGFNWAAYYSSNLIDYIEDAPSSVLENGDTVYDVSQSHYPIHGGTSRVKLGQGGDIIAVFVRVKAWLDGKPSNRLEKAQYLLSLGADYYPSVESSVSKGDFANANYLPGVAGSRFVYLTTEPQWFYMATVSPDDLSIVDKTSSYYRQGGKTYLSHDEWFDNPPPVSIYD